MNVNFGLFPPLADAPRKADRKALMSARAKADLATWREAIEAVPA